MRRTLSRAGLSWLIVALILAATASPASAQCAGDPCCGCSACDAQLKSCWTVRAGMVALERARPDAAALMTDSFAPGGTVLVDAADHRFGFELGPDLTVIRHGQNVELEFRWFQVHDWIAATPTVASPAGGVVPFVTPVGNPFFPANLSSRYVSWLDSFELNLRRPLNGWVSALAGFRYVQLNEQGLAVTHDIGPGLNTATYAVDAANGLYGFQIGLDGTIWDRGGRFHVEGFVKAGIYGDDARSRVAIAQTVGPAFGSAAASTHAAFAGELGVTAVYQVNPHLAVRGGYQLTWIEGVALASEQIAVSDPATGAGRIDLTGSPFYHGFTLAAELCW